MSLISLSSHDRMQLKSYKGLAVACSGGLDSVCLLVELYKLCGLQERPTPLQIIHINFHLRESTEANAAEALVQKLASSFSLPFFSYHPWPRYDGTKPFSEELWARSVARECYEHWWQKGYAVATAHHSDDQVETILFRLVRGSNPWNLAGLRRWHKGIFRPLLGVSKKDLRSYALEHGLSWQEDSTNTKTHHARNALRLEVIPRLEAIQSQAKASLMSCGVRSEQMADFIREGFAKRIRYRSLPLTVLPLYQETLCQLAFEALAGKPLKIPQACLRDVLASLKPNASQTFILDKGTLHLHRGRLFFVHQLPQQAALVSSPSYQEVSDQEQKYWITQLASITLYLESGELEVTHTQASSKGAMIKIVPAEVISRSHKDVYLSATETLKKQVFPVCNTRFIFVGVKPIMVSTLFVVFSLLEQKIEQKVEQKQKVKQTKENDKKKKENKKNTNRLRQMSHHSTNKESQDNESIHERMTLYQDRKFCLTSDDMVCKYTPYSQS